MRATKYKPAYGEARIDIGMSLTEWRDMFNGMYPNKKSEEIAFLKDVLFYLSNENISSGVYERDPDSEKNKKGEVVT